MKDAEDEAFDELARRQGAWGGGFTAKRKMAADKLLEEATRSCNNIDEQRALDALMRDAQPAQEPVAYVTGVSFGRFIVEPLNRAMILPVGMAFYTTSPQRTWVGLTDDEVMEMMGYDKQYGHIPQYARNFVEAISAKLKEKNK